jgi:uridylate kinase
MRRVLLKMSGEAFVEVEGDGVISIQRLDEYSRQIADAIKHDSQLQIAVVMGGGNIMRGKSFTGVSRTKADHMGMLATVINALALQDSLERFYIESRLISGIEVPKVAEPHILGRVLRHLEKGRVVILAGGTGNPFFTTDTAASLRAAEIDADVILLAKFGTDGVYDKDPRKTPEAVRFVQIGYDDILTLNLQVMDSTAVSMCRDNGTPIFVFDMESENGIYNALVGDTSDGTHIFPSARMIKAREDRQPSNVPMWSASIPVPVLA